MSNPGNMTYDESDHPRMGRTRKSSAKNEILIKPKLGAAKRTIREIPGDNFIYGMLNIYIDGVREALIHQAHVPDAGAVKGPDIKAMNKLAPKMHAARADEQRQHRKDHYIPLRVKQRLANVPPLPSITNPDHVYGLPIKRGDNMDDVIRYSSADEWMWMNQQHQHDYQTTTPLFVPVKTNRTTTMRSECCYHKYNPPPPKERFIISRFRNTARKIDNVQTTPFLQDERPPLFKRRNKKQEEEAGGVVPCIGMGCNVLSHKQGPSVASNSGHSVA